ncbi:MAG: thiol-disulfide isomerase, partial [Gammaproteobacteria bacterium]|nr:thiol-disulfide isomerase [Gammaproteobacteria bacterium]
PVLDALLENRSVAAANTLAVGCFCDWQEPVK